MCGATEATGYLHFFELGFNEIDYCRESLSCLVQSSGNLQSTLCPKVTVVRGFNAIETSGRVQIRVHCKFSKLKRSVIT